MGGDAEDINKLTYQQTGPDWSRPVFVRSSPTLFPVLGPDFQTLDWSAEPSSSIPTPDPMVFLASSVEHQVNEDLGDDFYIFLPNLTPRFHRPSLRP